MPALVSMLAGLGGAQQHLYSLAASPAHIGCLRHFQSIKRRVVHLLLAELPHIALLRTSILLDVVGDPRYLAAIQVTILNDVLELHLFVSDIDRWVQ